MYRNAFDSSNVLIQKYQVEDFITLENSDIHDVNQLPPMDLVYTNSHVNDMFSVHVIILGIKSFSKVIMGPPGMFNKEKSFRFPKSVSPRKYKTIEIGLAKKILYRADIHKMNPDENRSFLLKLERVMNQLIETSVGVQYSTISSYEV